jgi:hypothetical protein
MSYQEEQEVKPLREFTPMQFFGKNYSAVEAQQQRLLKALRDWVR